MQLNFNGGQVSENFTPRVDMNKYQTSCSLMRNFIPRQYGMLKRRNGFKLIQGFKNPVKIFKFQCTSNEEYLVCIHSDNQYASYGCKPFATILQCGHLDDPTRKWEVNLSIPRNNIPAWNGWTADKGNERHGRFWDVDLPKIKTVTQNDKMWIVHPDFYPLELTRTANVADVPSVDATDPSYGGTFSTTEYSSMKSNNTVYFTVNSPAIKAQEGDFFILNGEGGTLKYGLAKQGNTWRWKVTTPDGVEHIDTQTTVRVDSEGNVDFYAVNSTLQFIISRLETNGSPVYGLALSYPAQGKTTEGTQAFTSTVRLGLIQSIQFKGLGFNKVYTYIWDTTAYILKQHPSSSNFMGNFWLIGKTQDPSITKTITAYNSSAFPLISITQDGEEIYNGKDQISFILKPFRFLVHPKSDDNFRGWTYNYSSYGEANYIEPQCRSQDVAPSVTWIVAKNESFPNLQIYGDLCFTVAKGISTTNASAQFNEWTSGYTAGDVIIADVKMSSTTKTFRVADAYTKNATEAQAGAVRYHYVYGDWEVSTEVVVPVGYQLRVTSMENTWVNMLGYNPETSMVLQVSNMNIGEARKITASGSDKPGAFITTAILDKNGEVINEECKPQLEATETPFHFDVPFSLWRNAADDGDSHVLQNLTVMPYTYTPDTAGLFGNFSDQYGQTNYYYEKNGSNYYIRLENLYKSAFSVEKGYPSCVAIRNGRLIFASTYAQPQSIWASRVDRYEDFSVNDLADSGWDLTLGADQAQKIQWLSSSSDLFVGTDIGEWILKDDDPSNPVPTIREQSRWGSSYLQGAMMTESLFFVPRDRKGVVQSIYSFQIDGYQSEDVTIMASDLFDSGIVAQSIQKDPDPIWWGVTGDGRALGLLYNRTQEINGWFQLDIAGCHINDLVCYNNPVLGQEGMAVQFGIKDSQEIYTGGNNYFLAYMEEGNPCIDLAFSAVSATRSSGEAGFNEDTEYNSGQWFYLGVTNSHNDFNTILVNHWFSKQNGEWHPNPDKECQIDVISADVNGTTGWCWQMELKAPARVICEYVPVTDPEIPPFALSQLQAYGWCENGALSFKYTQTGGMTETLANTFNSFYAGLHINSEFVSLPMGNSGDYMIPVTTTKIDKLRYQVAYDDSNDIKASSTFLNDMGMAYGDPRIQTTVQAIDFQRPINLDKSRSLSVNTNLVNGRGHVVLSGQSSTDTRLYFSVNDAKKVNVLAAYVMYDSDLL